jgi:hypothetical protein
MFPLPAATPPLSKFSADALESRDAEAAGHAAAIDDPRLNGSGAEARYQEGLDE